MDVTLEPSGGHDFHRHPGQEEMIIVKQGRVTQYIEQESTTLGARRLRLSRRGRVHASYNDGDETAHLQVVIGPSLGGETGYGLEDVSGEEPWASLQLLAPGAVEQARRRRPRIDASTSSIGWNAGIGRPARRIAAVTCTRHRGCRSRTRPGAVASTWAPSGRRAPRGVRLDDVVDAGAAAADLLLGRLEPLELRDRVEHRARRGDDALRMRGGGTSPGTRRAAATAAAPRAARRATRRRRRRSRRRDP